LAARGPFPYGGENHFDVFEGLGAAVDSGSRSFGDECCGMVSYVGTEVWVKRTVVQLRYELNKSNAVLHLRDGRDIYFQN
jgi:hypothetical protein